MTADLTNSTVRILDSDREPVGTGILVSEKHVLTCAHVLNEALNRESGEKHQPEPETTVSLDFPIVALGRVVTAKVCRWWFEENEDWSGSKKCRCRRT